MKTKAVKARGSGPPGAHLHKGMPSLRKQLGSLALLLVPLAPVSPTSAATGSVTIPVLMYHNVGSYEGRYQVTTTIRAHQLNRL